MAKFSEQRKHGKNYIVTILAGGRAIEKVEVFAAGPAKAKQLARTKSSAEGQVKMQVRCA